jgi:hypothetical protein
MDDIDRGRKVPGTVLHDRLLVAVREFGAVLLVLQPSRVDELSALVVQVDDLAARLVLGGVLLCVAKRLNR